MSTLRQPKAAKSPKRTRTEWDGFLRARNELNEQRKRLDRESDALKKQVEGMDLELVAWLEAETAGQKEQQLSLKSFILSFVWKKPHATTLAFKAYGKLTPLEKATLAEEVGEQKKLEIQCRDATPPAAAAA